MLCKIANVMCVKISVIFCGWHKLLDLLKYMLGKKGYARLPTVFMIFEELFALDFSTPCVYVSVHTLQI